jgi:hypothetical protein
VFCCALRRAPDPVGYDRRMAARDTTPGAREAQLAVWRRLGGPGRVELAWQMSESAREISIAGILARSPALSREQARRLLLRRLLGAALFDAAYAGDEPPS